MKSPLLFVASIVLLIIISHFAYLPWFQPDKFHKLLLNHRNRLQNRYPYAPQVLWYKITSHFPKIDLWGARITSLLCVIFCLIGIIAAIWSPYVSP